jgi:hypothetical protein
MNGEYGAGLAAFDKLIAMLPQIAGAVVLIGLVWIISACRAR